MNIKTLEYIHKLLLEDVDSKAKAYKSASDLQHDYEERDLAPLAKEQEERADECMKLHFAAADALEDFERHDWR